LVEEECSADLARARWAFDGGLKEESRMNRVFGDGGLEADGLMLRTMRNLDSDDWKDLRADSRCGKMVRIELVVVLMLAVPILAPILKVFKYAQQCKSSLKLDSLFTSQTELSLRS